MAEWKKYTGSEEQIAEIMSSKAGFIKRMNVGKSAIHESNIIYPARFTESDIREIMTHADSFLICDPHPRREMIKQQADTGQDVYIRQPSIIHDGEWYELEPTDTPDWNIPNAEYRFTPFED